MNYTDNYPPITYIFQHGSLPINSTILFKVRSHIAISYPRIPVSMQKLFSIGDRIEFTSQGQHHLVATLPANLCMAMFSTTQEYMTVRASNVIGCSPKLNKMVKYIYVA